MRLFMASAALLFVSSSAAAQSRWTLSTGPEWSRGIPQIRTWGARFRAEYDLTPPNSVFGLRLEGGARWNPPQSYYFFDGIGTWAATDEEQFDVLLGFNASLAAPIPGPVSPYASLGVYRRQQWTSGYHSFGLSDSSSIRYEGTYSRANIVDGLGFGLRARLGGRLFQIEYRRLYDHNGLTFGTRLPF